MLDNDIIDALGGTSKVAELCEVTDQAVSQWRKEGIPSARRMYLKLLRPDVFNEGTIARGPDRRRVSTPISGVAVKAIKAKVGQ